MSLEVRYEAGVSATYEDITDRVRIPSLDVTQNAEEGSVAISTITIDDPNGDYEIKGYRRIAVYETEGEEDVSQLTYNGFIVGRRIIRGPSRTEAGRQWVCDLVDTNALLEFRIMTGDDADRPAETDIERLDWLLAESEMDRIPNHTYYNTSGPVAMSKADYRGQRAVDVINDCAQQSGKNYFAICVDATAAPIPAAPGATTFWYDHVGSTAYSSELTLSNDLADVLAAPGVCYEISLDTELVRNPERVYSGGYGQWDGGETYIEDTDISNEFTRRDAIIPMENVKNNTQATSRINRYLADMSTEEDRITTSVMLPAAQVNLIREGMRIPFKATHFMGYEEFVWQRVLRRTVKQLTPEVYLLTLTLGWSWPPTPLAECSVIGYNAGLIYGTLFGPTASGFYPYNSTAGTFGDYVNGMDDRVFYLGSGGGGDRQRPRIVTDPATGNAGGWSFAQHGVAKGGMPLGTADGGASVSGENGKLQIMAVGPGTMTIWATSVDSAYFELYRVDEDPDYPDDPDTHVMIDTAAMTFPSTDVVVPDDGACLHYVLVYDEGTLAGSLFYGGHDWVAS